MNLKTITLLFAKKSLSSQLVISKRNRFQTNQNPPFLELYKEVTGQKLSSDKFENVLKKEPNIVNITAENLQITLQILKKFGISPEEACWHPHLFCMNVISMDNYGEIFNECGFIKIIPKYLIRYNTIVKSRTILSLKKEGLLNNTLQLEEVLLDLFKEWPVREKILKQFPDASTNILSVRMSVLERYLAWRLSISSEDFAKYCKHYLPLRHRPMCDIQQALDIAENIIKFDQKVIKSNGFIISSDPVNTKLILENVDSLAGLDIKEALRLQPAILKNNYKSLLEIRDLLKQYEISEEYQRKCIRIFCMNPDSVRARFSELVDMKEYKILACNPRVLSLVVHQRKMLSRLSKIQTAKKQCFSLNQLVTSRKTFNTYINSFGSKVCSRDIAVLIMSSLKGDHVCQKSILKQLRRHKYWLHTALNVVHENICLLKSHYEDQVILDNCQILLYPVLEIKKYIDMFHNIRNGVTNVGERNGNKIDLICYNNLKYSQLSDSQILSLTLYVIEREYHFSGDGIWNKHDGGKEQTLKKLPKINAS